MKDKALIVAMLGLFLMAGVLDFASGLLSRLADLVMIGGGAVLLLKLWQRKAGELAGLREENKALARRIELLAPKSVEPRKVSA